MKKRELFKFLCGFLAGAGVVHANIGFAIATRQAFSSTAFVAAYAPAAPDSTTDSVRAAITSQSKPAKAQISAV